MKKGVWMLAAVAAAISFQLPCFAEEPKGGAPAANAQPGTEQPPAAGNPPAAQAPISPKEEKKLRREARSQEKKLVSEREKLDREFKKASEKFPEFCKHWEQNLRDRERDNRLKLVFTEKDGVHTATYVGYGEVKTCESHQSKDGFSIGKITYEEFTYNLSGKTHEEAVAAEKTTIGNVHTTEIFRWEKNEWFR
jgi:hypothetical protein